MSSSGRIVFTSSAGLQTACGKELQHHNLCLATKAKTRREIFRSMKITNAEYSKFSCNDLIQFYLRCVYQYHRKA